MIYLTLVPALILSLYAAAHPELQKVLGLAWDCGAVTTGPVTVPLVLSLGIGIASSTGKGNATLSGFGIVTLASLFPIIGVLGLAIYIAATVPVESIIQAATAGNPAAATQVWYESTPGREIVLGLRAILPLVLFLYLVMKLMLGEKIRHAGIITYGVILTIAGMCIFNLGLTYGLSRLGSESGSLLPAAFTHIAAVEASPLYLLYPWPHPGADIRLVSRLWCHHGRTGAEHTRADGTESDARLVQKVHADGSSLQRCRLRHRTGPRQDYL